jgi:hypothetical protein
MSSINPLESLRVGDILYGSQRFRIKALPQDKAVFSPTSELVHQAPSLENAIRYESILEDAGFFTGMPKIYGTHERPHLVQKYAERFFALDAILKQHVIRYV